MPYFIPNPFKDEWEDFNPQDFKDDLSEIVDEIIEASEEEDQEEIEELFNELDERFAQLIVMLKLKGFKEIEVVKASTLSNEYLINCGFTEEEIKEFDPEMVIPLISLQDIELENNFNKKKKNKWLK